MKYETEEEYLKAKSDLMAKVGVSNDNQLSKKLGYTSNSAISEWNRDKKIPDKILRKYYESNSTSTSNLHQIPLLSARVSAGSGADNYEIEEIDTIPIAEKYFKTKPNLKHLKALYVIGDSMSPTLNDSDIIVINENIGFISDGVYVIRMGNELRVKRLIKRLDGIEIKSDNPTYGMEFIKKNNNLLDFNILGKVILAIKRY